MPSPRRMACLGAALALANGAAAMAAVPCDPFRDQVHQAQALIKSRDQPGARRILEKIVADDPANVMGNFLLGTLALAQAGAADQQRGLEQVQFAVAQIPTHPAACAQQLGWYSLYITLGAQYYRRQNVADAKKALLIALAHKDALQPSSQRILFDDLGRIALAEGDLGAASNYYAQGAKLGNGNSAAAGAMVRRLQAQSVK